MPITPATVSPATPLVGGAAPAAAPSEAPQAEMPWLKETSKANAGPTAPAVKELQRLIKAAGFDPGPTDGWMGPKTARALKAFQSKKGIVTDAQAGPQTWGALGLKGAPRAQAPKGPGLPASPHLTSTIGMPSVTPGQSVSLEGDPHDRRNDWFLSQQPGPYNPNEDVQGNGNCGPSSVTMVARAFGKVQFDAGGADEAVEESRRRIGEGMDEKKGTSIAGLKKALTSYGLVAEVKSSPNIIALIQGELAEGKLCIAHVKATYLRANPRSGHYTTVTAIRDGMVYLNDSSNKNGPMAITIAEFERAVAARGTYTIITAHP